jgi:hypothetical protein
MDIHVQSRVKFTLPTIVVRYETVPLLSDNIKVSTEFDRQKLFTHIHM